LNYFDKQSWRMHAQTEGHYNLQCVVYQRLCFHFDALPTGSCANTKADYPPCLYLATLITNGRLAGGAYVVWNNEKEEDRMRHLEINRGGRLEQPGKAETAAVAAAKAAAVAAAVAAAKAGGGGGGGRHHDNRARHA
jgi:hypothetical protein